MAGSLSWKKYLTDAGVTYSVKIDEGNAEAAGFDDVTIADEIAGVVPPELPKGFKMRYVNVKDPASNSGRKIYVGKPDDGLATGLVKSLLLFAFSGGSAGAAIEWLVSSFVGEQNRVRIPSASDTGFLDGDAT